MSCQDLVSDVHASQGCCCANIVGGIIALETCVARRPISDMIDIYENQADHIWETRKEVVNYPAGPLNKIVASLKGKGVYEHTYLESVLKKFSRETALKKCDQILECSTAGCAPEPERTGC